MPKRNALRDVDPVAITICKQGANRQRIFLRKSTATDDLLALPAGRMNLLKAKDPGWTAFYCVVAEPGAEEDPGMVGEKGSVDVWESEEEIRKAAHRLLKNGAYVNAAHDSEAEAGCSIVESAVALTDLELETATIKKGSWYVAIEPTDDFREKVEAGDITGVSLEGTGVRVSIEKAADADNASTHRTCKGCGGKMAAGAGTCQNCGKAWVAKGQANASPSDRKKLKGLIEFYMKKPHPFRACVKDNTKRFGKGGAERVCATLKDIGEGTTKWRHGGNKIGKTHMSADTLADIYVAELEAAGVDTPEAVDLLKEYLEAELGERIPIAKTADFSERIAAVDLNDATWRAWNALQTTIYEAFSDDQEEDPKGVIERSLDQFREYLLGKLTAGDTTALAKVLGTVRHDPADEEDDHMGLAEDFAELKKQQDETTAAIQKSNDVTESLVGLVGKLTERVEALGVAAGAATGGKGSSSKDDKDGDGETDVKKAVELLGKLADKVDEFDRDLTGIAKTVAGLAEGDSSQRDDSDRIAKSKSDNPLRGLLD